MVDVRDDPIDSRRMDAELQTRLRALAAAGADEPLPFLVTLTPGARPEAVVPFEPSLHIELTRLVAGTMTPGQALALARHPQVERVEYDGQAQALAGGLAR